MLFMMVVIDYINVQTKNLWAEKMQNLPFLQIIISALLGIIPGCMGAFTIVSLYTHRMVGLAGLVTVMIATSGDEAFVMFSLIPREALWLNGILLMIAIVTGCIVHLFTRNSKSASSHGFIIHKHENCNCFIKGKIIKQLKNISFERTVLLLFTLVFIVFLLTGVIYTQAWDWKKISFLSGSVFLLFVFITVPEHFLKEHLFNHIIKRHILRIFLWTWGAFIALQFIQSNLVMTDLLQNNISLILLIGVVMGIIPESGPHLIFITLFSQNLIPFSILLANSIVQDGHGMLPLLAESRKTFFKVKAINILAGLLVGYILIQFGL